MKTKIFTGLVLLLICITLPVVSQDMILLRNGDEISAKVLEVNQDVITYKNWTNLEGPTYSKAKSEIFMIKYANGSKDIFEAITNSNNNITKTSSNLFLGTWYHKKYNGNSNKTVIIITQAIDNYLVEYKRNVRVDEYFFDKNDSFKEVGSIENGSIVINSMIKLSLLNENTLLMGSEEFTKICPASDKSSSINNQSNTQQVNTALTVPTYNGALNDGKKEGKGTEIYPDGSRYEGDWRNDMRNGFGVMYSADGNHYAGYWKDDKRDSTGVNIFPITSTAVIETKFEGIYKNDIEFNGKLTMTNWKGKKTECICTNGTYGKWFKVKD